MIAKIKNIVDMVPKWASFGTFLVFVVSSTIGFNAYFVKAADFKKLELRLEQKIVSDRADQLEQRAWALEDRYKGVDNMPPELKIEYRKILQEKEYLRSNLDKISGKLLE